MSPSFKQTHDSAAEMKPFQHYHHSGISESKIKRESPRNSLLRNQNLCFGSAKNEENRE